MGSELRPKGVLCPRDRLGFAAGVNALSPEISPAVVRCSDCASRFSPRNYGIRCQLNPAYENNLFVSSARSLG
jgi:hypothetical protein